MNRTVLRAALILSLALASCGPTPTPTVPPIVATVGGTVTSSTRASLTIPAGGLSADTRVTLTTATPTTAAPTGMTLVPGSAHTVSGDGSAQLTAGTLALPFDPATLGALGVTAQATAAQLRLYRLESGAWQPVPGTPVVDAARSLVAQAISSFGTYALLAPTQSGATLATITLSCAATTLTAGAGTTCAATARDGTGAALTTQPGFTFTSSAPGVATVTGTGQVTAVAAGTTSITASAGGVTSNAVTITVNAAQTSGPQVITTATLFMVDISRGGAIYYHGFEGNGEVSRTVLNGTVRDLPAMPGGHRPTTGLNPYDRACVSNAGNVTVRTQAQSGNTTAYATHHFDAASGTYAALPLANQDPIVVACRDDRVLLSTVTGGDPVIHASTWTPGGTLTALPDVNTVTCVGCSAVDTNWTGKTLYSTGLQDGATFTAITTNGFFARRLMPDGSALGMRSQQELDTWTPGSAATVLPGQPVNLMTLLDVNDHGDILAASAGSVNWQWRLWLRRAGTWTEINPGTGRAFVNDARNYYGLTNDGRALVKTADAATSAYKALVLY